jgi:predicted O-linked N-acetylglucosamine transferase (SPINDLY family)
LAKTSPLPRSAPTDATLAFQQAASLHAQGRLWEADQLYQVVLGADGCHFGALCRLGVIRLQQGRFEDAAALLRRALKADKNSADAHQGLAFALTGLERFEEAIRHYERALALRPGFAEAHNNLGHALQRLGRFNAAIAQYEKALAVNPAYAEARNNLGNATHLLGREEDAITHYEKAIALKLDYAEAYWNLGNALRALGRFDEAIAQYGKALEIRPDYAEAHNSIGNALRLLARSEAAIAHYEKALAISPDYADARVNLGDALETLGRQQEAIAQYEKALAIRPSDPDALSKRGDAFTKLKRYDEALATFEEALAIDSGHAHAFAGLASAAKAACDWSRTEKIARELLRRSAAATLLEPFTLLGYSSDPALQLACANAYVAHHVPIAPPRFWNGEVWRNPRIRIGYFGAGFHEHPMAFLTAELFEIHDRSRFEVLGISLGPDDRSEMRSRLVGAFDTFHDLRSINDREAAKLINDLRVDIIVDRSGYTTGARPEILACRPAPIQVNYLGYPGTLGAEFYDYLIADPIVLPFDQQKFVTETIVHLPECYQVNDSTRGIVPTPTRQATGLPDQGFVFCCFNNNTKITAEMFEIWMRLLRRLDGSVLWLLSTNATAEANLRREAAARGIDPARLVFAGRVKLDQHLARHRLADLFLDTLPYNAHTTASDALWAGLPLLTCHGEYFPGRVATSLLRAIGLPELVTYTLQHNRLTHPLFDTDRFRRHIEAAYTQMWELWQRGESPRSFSVAPVSNDA